MVPYIKYLSKDDIKELASLLSDYGIRDEEFQTLDSISGGEYFPVTKLGVNYKVQADKVKYMLSPGPYNIDVSLDNINLLPVNPTDIQKKTAYLINDLLYVWNGSGWSAEEFHGNGIKSAVTYYQLGDSGTLKPIGDWTENMPAVELGKFLWSKTVLIDTQDRIISTIYGVSKDSITYYPHYAYADTPDGLSGFSFTDSDNTKLYMGFYLDTNEEGSTDASKYAWHRARITDDTVTIAELNAAKKVLQDNIDLNSGLINDNKNSIISQGTAIEQTNSSITTLAGRVTVNESNRTADLTLIQQNATSIGVLANRVTTTEDNITKNTTAIGINAAGITTKVEQTVYDNNNNIINDKFSTVKQTTDGLSIDIQNTATNAATDAYNKANAAKIAAINESAQATAQLYVKATLYNQDISTLQAQIDGAIDDWFYPNDPSSSVEPEVNWTTDTIRNKHLGDLFYNTVSGHCYRYQLSNSVYSWGIVSDTDIAKALADAAKAQDTADHKRRVFVNTPIAPYDIGDMWAQGGNGDILICETPRTTSQTYQLSDWVLASKYTDDTLASKAKSDAAAAQSDATSALNNITSIISDNILDSSEKPSQRQAWNTISVEKSNIDSHADTFGVSRTDYDTAFQTLADYLNNGVSYTTGIPTWLSDINLSSNTTIVGSTYRTNWENYYTKRTLLLNSIAEKAKTLADSAQNSANAAQTTATNAANAASAAQTDATSALNHIGDIISDNVLSPAEKPAERKEWNIIATEKSNIDSQADTFTISRINYDNAFQALATYLNNGVTYSTGVPSWISDSNLSVYTTINGSNYRSYWESYYNQRTLILNLIAKTAKDIADSKATQQNIDDATTVAKTYTDTQFSTLSGEISSKVSQLDFNALGVTVGAHTTAIAQNASDITTKVSTTDYTGAKVASLINQSASTVTIEASHINLVGAITLEAIDKSSVTAAALGGATPANVTTAVDNIQIGGRNLARGSKGDFTYTLTDIDNQVAIMCIAYWVGNKSKNIVISGDVEYSNIVFTGTGKHNITIQGAQDVGVWNHNLYFILNDKISEGNGKFHFASAHSESSILNNNLWYFGFRSDYITGTITFKNLKVEYGTKETSWTPAPEDVDASINLKVSKDGVIGAINLTSEAATIQASKINLVGAVTISAIDKSSVTASALGGATPTDVNTAVNNIQIGGTNLILNSQTLSSFGLSGNAEVNDGIMSSLNATTNNYMVIYNISVLPNTYYILSCYVKTNNSSSKSILAIWDNISSGIISSITNTFWKRYSKTFYTGNNSSVSISFNNVPTTVDGYSLYITKPKLEVGNKATDWSPAPEDVSQFAIDKVKELSDAHGGLTYLDHNSIYTGTLTAGQVNAVAINAASIATGTLSADRIGAKSIAFGKLVGTDITALGNVTAGSFNIGSGKFVVDANGNLTATNANITGKINALSGNLGEFVINGQGIINTNTSNVFGAAAQANVTCINTTLGIQASIGVNVLAEDSNHSVAFFQNYYNGDYVSPNYALTLGAKKAQNYEGNSGNIACMSWGGCHAGFGLHVRLYEASSSSSNSLILGHPDNVVTIYGNNGYWANITLPTMHYWDDGHIIILKNLIPDGGNIHIYPGLYYDENTNQYNSYMYIDTGTLISSGNSVQLMAMMDSMMFIFHASMETGSYKGCWVQYKLPRDW